MRACGVVRRLGPGVLGAEPRLLRGPHRPASASSRLLGPPRRCAGLGGLGRAPGRPALVGCGGLRGSRGAGKRVRGSGLLGGAAGGAPARRGPRVGLWRARCSRRARNCGQRVPACVRRGGTAGTARGASPLPACLAPHVLPPATLRVRGEPLVAWEPARTFAVTCRPGLVCGVGARAVRGAFPEAAAA